MPLNDRALSSVIKIFQGEYVLNVMSTRVASSVYKINLLK